MWSSCVLKLDYYKYWNPWHCAVSIGGRCYTRGFWNLILVMSRPSARKKEMKKEPSRVCCGYCEQGWQMPHNNLEYRPKKYAFANNLVLASHTPAPLYNNLPTQQLSTLRENVPKQCYIIFNKLNHVMWQLWLKALYRGSRILICHCLNGLNHIFNYPVFAWLRLSQSLYTCMHMSQRKETIVLVWNH